MTSHEHTHHAGHGSAHHDTHQHGPDSEHGFPDDDAYLTILDLDALVFADLLADVLTQVAAVAPRPTRTVVDLGAGTGTGTRALARTFPDAQVVAVDASPTMLARIRSGAHDAGIADRVRTVQADLDAAWPEALGAGEPGTPGTVDVVWASASMHHLADPDRVLRDAFAALAPGGLVAIVEMTGTTPVLPPDAGRPGLADRVTAAMDHARWNQYPDWSTHLEAAGFDVLDRVELHSTPEPGPDLTRWVRTMLGRQRDHLGEQLDPADIAALGEIADGPDAATSGITARAGRVLWTARRPA